MHVRMSEICWRANKSSVLGAGSKSFAFAFALAVSAARAVDIDFEARDRAAETSFHKNTFAANRATTRTPRMLNEAAIHKCDCPAALTRGGVTPAVVAGFGWGMVPLPAALSRSRGD